MSNIVAKAFHWVADIIGGIRGKWGDAVHRYAYSVQESSQKKLYLITYPECEECNGDNDFTLPLPNTDEVKYCPIGEFYLTGSSTTDVLKCDPITFFTVPTPTTCTGVHLVGGATYNDKLNNFITDQHKYYILTYSGVSKTISTNQEVVEITGIKNKINKVFTLSKSISPLYITYVYNGILLKQGLDYTILGNVLTFTYAPSPEDELSVISNLSEGTEIVFTGSISLTGSTNLNAFINTPPLEFTDIDNVLNEDIKYYVSIGDEGVIMTGIKSSIGVETGCGLYDTLYNEHLVNGWFDDTYDPRKLTVGSPKKGDNVSAELISDENIYPLPTYYKGQTYIPETKSGMAEFSNGVFYMMPGVFTNKRIFQVLKEYRRRKRVGTLFCGGIVNYSFIDNWLSGSLYFFQFKAKVKWDNEDTLDLNYQNTRYCKKVVYYKVQEVSGGTAVKKFYYRSAPFSASTQTFGEKITYMDQPNPLTPLVKPQTHPIKPYRYRLNHPTTFVDLGPRDEFISEICTDPALDPNCSVSRTIGPTSFQNFGEIMGLIINYRLDTFVENENNKDNAIKEFFSNKGFLDNGFNNGVLNGDILQLISINNEAGIFEFDLQNPRYLGYSYQMLDPDLFSEVFQLTTGVFGPTPITFSLDNDGQQVRACLNEPGRLTESSQVVPFFLWEKGGTGFGPYDEEKKYNQAWSYTGVSSQPLQGMTYGYTLNGVNDDPSDKYLLLPMTYDFKGQVISGNAVNTVDVNVIGKFGDPDEHGFYNSQYPGFTYLYVTRIINETDEHGVITEVPDAGILYTRYGAAGTDGIVGWHAIPWDTTVDFIIKKTSDYYSGTKQILSTPFQFYFGLRPGNTGMDKFIKRFGPKGAFPSAE